MYQVRILFNPLGANHEHIRAENTLHTTLYPKAKPQVLQAGMLEAKA